MGFKFSFERNDRLFFLTVAFLLFSIKVLSKSYDASLNIQWPAFFNPALVTPLAIVILVNAMFFILARNWSRILHIPVSFMFLSLPFFLYFMLQVNCLFCRWDDRAVLWVALVGLTFGQWFLRGKQKVSPKNGLWLRLLMSLFIIQGVLLFLGQNFRLDRVPFADENTFWYSAARQMLELGFLAAQRVEYLGGDLHPFGIPFLSALSGILFNYTSPIILFFMPIYVLVGLILVLLDMDRQKFKYVGMMFFLVAWFASFNNRSWPGMLSYSMVYGESVSMLFVISLLNWLFLNNDEMTCRSWKLSAFLMGLTTLTKFPLLLLSVAFFTVFLKQAWTKSQDIKRLLTMTISFMVPLLVLKIFQATYGGSVASLGIEAGELLQRLGSPNLDMLARTVLNIYDDAGNLTYYFIIALSFSLVSKEWQRGWPVMLWLVLLIVYYAYIYAYGLEGGDTGSGLRYFMPAAAGIFLLGADGLSRLTNTLEKIPNRLCRWPLYLILLAVIFYKMF